MEKRRRTWPVLGKGEARKNDQMAATWRQRGTSSGVWKRRGNPWKRGGISPIFFGKGEAVLGKGEACLPFSKGLPPLFQKKRGRRLPFSKFLAPCARWVPNTRELPAAMFTRARVPLPCLRARWQLFVREWSDHTFWLKVPIGPKPTKVITILFFS